MAKRSLGAPPWAQWVLKRWPPSYFIQRSLYLRLKARLDARNRKKMTERYLAYGEDAQSAFLRLARLFEPMRVKGLNKIRVGSSNDGGYVMLDDFRDVGGAISMGVETNIDWDLAIAARGLIVRQFDHTVDHALSADPLIQFAPLKVSAIDEPGSITMDQAIEDLGMQPNEAAICKIDIEGDEWPVFEAAEIERLARCSQIICELHNFSAAADPVWLERALKVMTKLRSRFDVFHVHANNWDDFTTFANVPFPETLEVSLGNRARYQFEETDERFPIEIDRPNRPNFADLHLGAFRF
ncbi:MAG: hypothetical protein WDN46_06035 [Methylocella sp.]